jgi:ribosomal protein L3
MTRVLIDGVLTPVTIVELLSQKVIRHKTQDRDGYDALVVGVIGKNDTYKKQKEFNISAELLESYPV